MPRKKGENPAANHSGVERGGLRGRQDREDTDVTACVCG